MEFPQFITWLFYTVMGGSAFWAVTILREMKTSVESLNVNVAVVVSNIAYHKEILDRHEKELDTLRNNKGV